MRLELFRTCPVFSRPAQPRHFHPELSRTKASTSRMRWGPVSDHAPCRNTPSPARWHRHGGPWRQTLVAGVGRVSSGSVSAGTRVRAFLALTQPTSSRLDKPIAKSSTAARCMAPTHRAVRPTARLRLARVFPVSRTGACRYRSPRVGLFVARRRQAKRNLGTTRSGMSWRALGHATARCPRARLHAAEPVHSASDFTVRKSPSKLRSCPR